MTLIPPDKALIKEILAEINLTEEELHECCEKLKDWLKKQPHLPQYNNDAFLKSFIVNGKSLEGAKSRIELYYQLRSSHPKVLGDRSLKAATRDKFIKVLVVPKLTPDGCRVKMFITQPVGPAQMDAFSHLNWTHMINDLLLLEEYPTKGIYIIHDVRHATPSHLAAVPLIECLKFFREMQGAIPLRVKGIIWINAAPFLDVALNTLVKPIAPDKLFERLHLYSQGMEVLKNHFPVEILPNDYGGQEKSSDELHEDWLNKLESMEGWFTTVGSQVVDESLRIKDLKNENFGLPGSFRKLQVD